VQRLAPAEGYPAKLWETFLTGSAPAELTPYLAVALGEKTRSSSARRRHPKLHVISQRLQLLGDMLRPSFVAINAME
jgi:hypothetical protein